MQIKNKLLYNYYKQLKGIRQEYTRNESHGIYIHGYKNGICVYTTDGAAIIETFIDDKNCSEFISHYLTWEQKEGVIDTAELMKLEDLADYNKLLGYMNTPKISWMAVNEKEFRRTMREAVKFDNAPKHCTLSIVLAVYEDEAYMIGNCAKYGVNENKVVPLRTEMICNVKDTTLAHFDPRYAKLAKGFDGVIHVSYSESTRPGQYGKFLFLDGSNHALICQRVALDDFNLEKVMKEYKKEQLKNGGVR
jgi:hypothetical protein